MSDELRKITETSDQALVRWLQLHELDAEAKIAELEGELQAAEHDNKGWARRVTPREQVQASLTLAEAKIAELEGELKCSRAEVERLRAEGANPNPMGTAPKDMDIYLVHEHTPQTEYGSQGEFATTRGRWGEIDSWWYGVGGYDLRPVGWYPVPRATDSQALEVAIESKEGGA